MPELPEVEVTVRGIKCLINKEITKLTVRNSRFRRPVPSCLQRHVVGKSVRGVTRRAKYILIELPEGHILLHLGMSGSLRWSPLQDSPKKHDHVEFEIGGDLLLRFHDPRRFGCILWIESDPSQFHLLANLGIDPLDEEQFTGEYLKQASCRRKVAVKKMIMNSRVVAGIGNIYASEVLFRAGIHPTRGVKEISCTSYGKLAKCIRETMMEAIDAGGTTLKDWKNPKGNEGKFSQNLLVYGCENKCCKQCKTPIKKTVIGRRPTYFCPQCQT